MNGKKATDLTRVTSASSGNLLMVHDGAGLKSITVGNLQNFINSPIENKIAPLIVTGAGAHNAIYRGKNLGSSVTNTQYSAISSGTFDDLYIGDYWSINGVNYRIAGFDYYYRCGDNDFTKHHIVLVPDTQLYTHCMNDTNTTEGGYVGSKMYKEGLEQAKKTIKAAFPNHVATHRIYLTNAVSNGRPSGGAWFDSEVDLMTEAMLYGCRHYSPMNNGVDIPTNYTVERGQLPLFHLAPNFIHANRQTWFWLRDVVSAAAFAYADFNGLAYYYNASGACGVRPAFCLS